MISLLAFPAKLAMTRLMSAVVAVSETPRMAYGHFLKDGQTIFGFGDWNFQNMIFFNGHAEKENPSKCRTQLIKMPNKWNKMKQRFIASTTFIHGCVSPARRWTSFHSRHSYPGRSPNATSSYWTRKSRDSRSISATAAARLVASMTSAAVGFGLEE